MLHLLLTQVPTTRVLALLTFRPEFVSPWGTHSYLSQLTLSRLDQPQVTAMIDQVTGGKALPAEVVQQIVTKTDGVPLFVEELTKMVVESGLVQAVNHHYELSGSVSDLAIPSTLQDSLMARLDRLNTAKEVAQLGATIGREFPYALLQAVSSLEEGTLRQGLGQLVDVELLYQRGLPPQAVYVFKHALIQDTAYQSLLKSHRQHYHEQIALVLETQFPETTQTQPEVVAHHFTEAGLADQAIPYWQQAGRQAVARSANLEAVAHLRKGLEVVSSVPDPATRQQQELGLQILLAPALMATRGHAVPEVEHAYLRAQELCLQLGESAQLFSVLRGLIGVYIMRAEPARALALTEQGFSLAHQTGRSVSLMWMHYVRGVARYFLGDFATASTDFEQALALYDPQKRRVPRALHDPSVASLSYNTLALYQRGYPDQGLAATQAALARAHELSHPISICFALMNAALLHQFRREAELVRSRAEAVIALATEHDFPEWLPQAMSVRGWALALLGQEAEGIRLLVEGLAGQLRIGLETRRSRYLALLAEAYGHSGQTEEGLTTVREGLAFVERTGERIYEAELYRLKGELLLNAERRTMNAERKTQEPPHSGQAEVSFQKALDVARQQEAKSFELRAATNLARLWQSQGKTREARDLLTPVYEWFTEGFDTADLKDAQVVLEELA